MKCPRKLKILNFYLKETGNPFFVLKIIFFGIIDKLKFNSRWNKSNSKWHKSLMRLLNKGTILKTDFGTYKAYPYLSWILNPYYEEDIRKVLSKNFEEFKEDKDKVFIDVGAHVGRYAIDLAKNNNYYVLAFEPSQATYALLQKNIRLSNLTKKIKTYNYALGKENKKTYFREDGFQEGANRILDDKDKRYDDATQVQIKRFDDNIKDIEPKNIRLIIIDVEGFEYDVLLGMKNCLKGTSDIDVIIEIFEDNKLKSTTIKFMNSLGFKHRRIDTENYHFYKRT